MVSGLLGFVDADSIAKLPRALATSCLIILLLIGIVSVPLIYMLVAALTVQAQEQQPVSAKRAWHRIRHQSHLVTTTFMLGVACVGAIVLLTLVAALLGLLDPIIGELLFEWPGGLAIFFVLLPFALAIPLVIIRRPAKNEEFLALDVSQRLSRGIVLTLAAVVLLSACPNWATSGLAKLIHLPTQFATPAHWIGGVFDHIVAAVSTALLYIALTLIAIERSTADSPRETLPPTTLEPHSASQVVIL